VPNVTAMTEFRQTQKIKQTPEGGRASHGRKARAAFGSLDRIWMKRLWTVKPLAPRNRSMAIVRKLET
jgi:hypothetical protein